MQSQGINAEVKVTVPDLAKEKTKRKELTVTFFVGGVQVDELTEEQVDRMAERLSKTMSTYYTARSAEYTKIQ